MEESKDAKELYMIALTKEQVNVIIEALNNAYSLPETARFIKLNKQLQAYRKIAIDEEKED